MDRLYSPLKLGENSVVLCPPLYGKDHCFNHVLDRSSYRNKLLGSFIDRFIFNEIVLLVSEEKSSQSWLNQLSEGIVEGGSTSFSVLKKSLIHTINNGHEIVYLINVSENISDSQLQDFFELCQKVYYISHSRIHFLFFLDHKWDEAHLYELLSPFRSLCQNIALLPLYSDEEVAFFVRHLTSRWSYPIEGQVVDYIVKQAGGVLLLAKAIVRLLIKKKQETIADIESEILTDNEYLAQVKFFVYRLTPNQRKVLKQVANKQKVEDVEELNQLVLINLVRRNSGDYHIRSLSVANYFNELVLDLSSLSMIIDGRQDFSSREKKILRFFIDKLNTSVSRDKLAAVMWTEAEVAGGYSDWAIDKAISRLREKLEQDHHLSSLEIDTLKKEGFIARYSLAEKDATHES